MDQISMTLWCSSESQKALKHFYYSLKYLTKRNREMDRMSIDHKRRSFPLTINQPSINYLISYNYAIVLELDHYTGRFADELWLYDDIRYSVILAEIFLSDWISNTRNHSIVSQSKWIAPIWGFNNYFWEYIITFMYLSSNSHAVVEIFLIPPFHMTCIS